MVTNLNFVGGWGGAVDFHRSEIGLWEYSCTLLEKQSKQPRFNMKCRGKPDTTWNIPRSITFSPLQFMSYREKSISVGTVHLEFLRLISVHFLQTFCFYVPKYTQTMLLWSEFCLASNWSYCYDYKKCRKFILIFDVIYHIEKFT